MRYEMMIKLDQCQDLPTIPDVAKAIIDLMKEPEPDFDKLTKAFKLDTAIITRLLKAVNSPIYALVNQVTSVKEAIKLLGYKDVMQIGLTLSLSKALQKKRPKGLDYKYIWKRSVIAATSARAMAQHKDEAEPLFLAALLQDTVGILALTQIYGQEYLRTTSGMLHSHIDLLRSEDMAYGCTHADVGAYLLEQ